MKSIGRHGVWAVLLVGCVSAAVVSCGSDDDKKRTQNEFGGQGGAAEPGASGSPEQSPGGGGGASAGTGAAGEPAAAAGGAGGEPPSSAGAPSVAGAGGEGPALACLPSGAVQGFSLNPEPTYSVCRAARLGIPFDAESSPAAFTCCASSEGTPAFGLELSGVTYFDGGDLAFVLPADAPLGLQYLTVTCDGSAGENTLALDVKETEPPVVTGVTAVLPSTGVLTVTGTNLENVTYIGAVGPDGYEYACDIEGESHGDTSVECYFGGLPYNEGYQLIVYQNECGYALGSFTFDVLLWN